MLSIRDRFAIAIKKKCMLLTMIGGFSILALIQQKFAQTRLDNLAIIDNHGH